MPCTHCARARHDVRERRRARYPFRDSSAVAVGLVAEPHTIYTMFSLRVHGFSRAFACRSLAIPPSAIASCGRSAIATQRPYAPSLGAAAHRGMSSVGTLGVVGAGQMGNGIAWVGAVRAKVPAVVVVDNSQAQLDNARAFAEKLLRKEVAKERLSQGDADAALGRLTYTTSLDALAPADFVVEAVSEDVSLKKKIFSSLDAVVKPGSVLASNTSTIMITKLQHESVTKRPDKVIARTLL